MCTPRVIILVITILNVAASRTLPLRVMSWNVYWKALDDAHGQAAIVNAIDSADQSGDVKYSFAAIIEASGDTPAGNVANWSQSSATLSAMKSVAYRSGYEDVAIFFDAARWELIGEPFGGAFETGRPFLLAQFAEKQTQAKTGEPSSLAQKKGTKQRAVTNASTVKTVWVLAVHLNHFFLNPPALDPVEPGKVLASFLANVSSATGVSLAADDVPLLMMGDWNEYMWADFPQPYRATAATDMFHLWVGYLLGKMSDAVPPRTTSCCTKWSRADRATRSEWIFQYDHIFFSHSALQLTPSGWNASGATAPFLPYVYPGTAATCADPACTGQDPPKNQSTVMQGSWHRGVEATFALL